MGTCDNFLPLTFYVLHPLPQGFLEACGVVSPSGAVCPFGDVSPSRVAGAESENAVVLVAAVSEIFEPWIVFVALVSVADISEPRASFDIALAFDVLFPVSLFAVVVDSSGRPKFFPFPNIDYYASFSSSAEAVGEESVHGPIGVRTNHGLYSIPSTPDLHQNKNSEHGYNKPNPGYNSVTDTNDPPMDATTSHSRKICLLVYQGQRKRRAYQASLSQPEVPEMRWVVAEQFQHLHLLLPLLGREGQLSTPKGLSPKVTFSFCCLLIQF